MGFFSKLKHSVSKDILNPAKRYTTKASRDVKHKLATTSFRDILVKADSRNQSIRKAVGVKGLEDTTQLEQIEYVSKKVEKGTEFAESPGVRHIPIIGSILGEIHSTAGAGEIASGTGALNTAIDEQDRAAKKNQSSIHHYKNIAKSGVAVGKTANKHYQEKQTTADHLKARDSRGDQTTHRSHPDLVM
jgi:hypothetical protein